MTLGKGRPQLKFGAESPQQEHSVPRKDHANKPCGNLWKLAFHHVSAEFFTYPKLPGAPSAPNLCGT